MIDSPTVILVVEDEALLRLLLMEVLEEGRFPRRSRRGQQMTQPSSLLIGPTSDWRFTDVDMPGALNGFQLAQYVQDHHRDVAVIIGSGQCRPGPEDITPGTDLLLQKPYSTSALVNHVRRMTSREQGGARSPPLPSSASRH